MLNLKTLSSRITVFCTAGIPLFLFSCMALSPQRVEHVVHSSISNCRKHCNQFEWMTCLEVHDNYCLIGHSEQKGKEDPRVSTGNIPLHIIEIGLRDIIKMDENSTLFIEIANNIQEGLKTFIRVQFSAYDISSNMQNKYFEAFFSFNKEADSLVVYNLVESLQSGSHYTYYLVKLQDGTITQESYKPDN